MRFILISLILASISISQASQASAGLLCESVFSEAKAYAPQSIESQLLAAALSSSADGLFRSKAGRLGYTAFTLDTSIDLSRVSIEGIEARVANREGERFGLDLIIRDRVRAHDFWKVSLASEVDALAYLVSVKLGLPVVLKENAALRAFHVVSGESDAQFGDPTQTENMVGEKLQIVGIETNLQARFDEAEVVLKLRDIETGEFIAMSSRSGATAVRALRTILQTGKVKLASPGIYFSIPSEAPVGTRRFGRSN